MVVGNIHDKEISIHALRAEGDAMIQLMPGPRLEFLSTPSVRRATRVFGGLLGGVEDFYPRPPCGGRLVHGFTSHKI